jgi:hypothetical protein
MKTRISTVALCAVLAGFSPFLFAALAANDQNSTAAITNTDAQPVQLSPGLDDVVKLTKGGVSESVIITYVQSSGVMYRPTAEDLIQLREAGVSGQVTTALLQRGGELHQSALKSQQQAQAAARTAAQTRSAQPAQPATTYAAAPTYLTPPPASASTVTYIGAPKHLTYPVNSYYSYGGYCRPRYYPRYYSY